MKVSYLSLWKGTGCQSKRVSVRDIVTGVHLREVSVLQSYTKRAGINLVSGKRVDKQFTKAHDELKV